MKRVLVLLLALCLACMISAASAETEQLTKIVFCLDWTPNTNHTGVYVAQALGYYKEAGLDVEIVQPPENGAVLMCAAGQAQFAVDAQDTMAASLDLDEPLGVTAVAALLQHNTSGILSRAEDGITSAKGLENRVYATWDSPIELAMLRYCMEKEGGDFSKVRLIPNNVTDEPAALAAHQIDAVWIFYGWSGINAELSDIACGYWDFASVSSELDYYTPVLLANNDFLAQNPETARAFLKATEKGYRYAVEHPEEAADLLIAGDSTGSLSDSRDLVVASQKWLSKQYIADAPDWGVFDAERWNAFYTWLSSNGLTVHNLTGLGFTNDYLTGE
ncbi:MAG: ABC transporter substrate-binding protein [Clostridiales bacterium]|nr:ABC transporter substrate-binding protein [Clostridiales bacterium]